jgi:hypothetical protein
MRRENIKFSHSAMYSITRIALIVLTFLGVIGAVCWIAFDLHFSHAKQNSSPNSSNFAMKNSVSANNENSNRKENSQNNPANIEKNNATKLSKEEKLRIGKEMQDKKSQNKEPNQSSRNNTLDSVWKWWETMIALEDEYAKKYPELAEGNMRTKLTYDSSEMSLIQNLRIENMNPVQRQEKYGKEDELAAIWVRHIDEYLAIATNERGIRDAQFMRANLLEEFDINKKPYIERNTQAGESFDAAYDSGLRDGKCLLRTARFAAGKYADAYEYDKAISFLEKAENDAKSGKYEVRDSGPLNAEEIRASLADIESTIAKYQNLKPLAEAKRKNAAEYDQMMEEQKASDRAEVEAYQKRIERGEVPATGRPDQGVKYDFLGRPLASPNTSPLAPTTSYTVIPPKRDTATSNTKEPSSAMNQK